jgi:hypothetical protein
MLLPRMIVFTTFLAGVMAGVISAKAMVWPPPPHVFGVVLLLVSVVVLMLALLQWYAIRFGKEIMSSGVETHQKIRMFTDLFEPVMKPLGVIKDLASISGKGGS